MRLPVLLFRAGLGGLFGGRLVLVEHVGRRTGTAHAVVLEVVARDDADGSVVVASGYGPGADWYRNLCAHPDTTMRAGRRRAPVTARPLDTEQAAQAMTTYAQRHPSTARRVVRLMGFQIDDGAPPDWAAIGRAVPFLALVPRRQ